MTGVFLLSLAFGFVWMGASNEKVDEVCEPRSNRSISSVFTAKNK
jgi:hypothetical protein